MLKRNLCLVMMALLVTTVTYAQVTSSSITGTVRDNNNQPLVGASITATHTPSGTQYTTISTKEGVFTLPNVRIGGPYQLKIDYVGMKSQTIEGFSLLLGEPYNVNAVLGENVQIMENVIVTGRARRAATDKTGAVTNIGIRQINTMPSITRSITDFTRLTPQANGNSFGGRDARYNNIQVDGANLNNNFGLSNDPLPGGGNNPISLDAIEEISVNIAPFDVRQANFTGAGISAVTRSGDNTYKGSAYGYYRDQSFNGRNVGKIELPKSQESSTKIYGARVGGPIIKNKLFFFISAEKETRTFPGIAFRPGQPGVSGSNISSTPVDSLKKLSDFLKAQYNYDPGPFDNFPSFSADNRKLLARVDWNMSRNHKLILKYSDFESTNDVQLNGTSIPGGGFGSLTRLANNRFSNASMAFANSNYAFKDIVHSGTIELASKFGNKFSNQFLGTYTKIGATRIFNGGVFPTIDFLNLAPAAPLNNQNYMHAGMDPFTYNNDVINRIYSIIDNFSYFAGKHTITAGGSYEHQSVGNMFMPASNSYYIFRSLDDFITNQAPAYYAYTYSLVKGQKTVYSAELNIAQLGFYLQDEININSRLKLTFGIRADRPIYDDQPIENPEITKLTLPDKFGSPTNYSTGTWPNASWYWSPRGGFRWDMEGDKSLIIRGGTGLFTGRIPFVWLTNIPTNSAMYQITAGVTTTAALQNYKFNPNPDAYASTFPIITSGSIPNNANFVVTNPNFKFPQVWRTNLAIDKNLGKGYSFSLEAIYNKDINAVWMRNANLKAPDGTFAGADNRPRYLTPSRIYGTAPTNINTLIVLENTTKGGAFMLTAQVNKAFTQGLYGSFAYTYTHAMDVTNNPGSQASSVWNSNPNSRTANTLESGYSGFAVPHRFVGSLSYRKEYLKHLATTLSFFYEASNSDVYSFTYSADLNGDGNGFDLMYIPRNASEIIFVNSTINGVVYTPAQQWEIFNQFIEKDPYLSKRRGSYAERNGAKVPFYHRLDAKILQDIFTSIGSRRHTLQFSVDVLNLPNLVNKDWGIRKATVSRNPLAPAGPNANGVPTFRLNSANNQPITSSFQDVVSTSSTWGIQLGLRYIF